MELPPLPPEDLVYTALRQMVLPAAGVAAFAFSLFLAFGRKAGALGSAVAILAGMAYVNWTDLKIPWKPDRYAWEWLPRTALAVTVVGLVSRCLGFGNFFAVWLPRLAISIVAAKWLIPLRVVEPDPWIVFTFAAVMFLEWLVLDSLSRAGKAASVALYQAMILFAGSGVIIYAHSARFMESSVIAGSALFGIAVVAAAARPTSAWGSIPAGVVLNLGLLLSARVGLDTKVPLTSYWLVGLAPLVLAPWLIPALARREGNVMQIVRFVFVLIPLVIAVALAGQQEMLPWEGDQGEQW